MRAWGDWPALSLAKSFGKKRLGQVSWLSAVLAVRVAFRAKRGVSRTEVAAALRAPFPAPLQFLERIRQWGPSPLDPRLSGLAVGTESATADYSGGTAAEFHGLPFCVPSTSGGRGAT
jgi:hypothetical protein